MRKGIHYTFSQKKIIKSVEGIMKEKFGKEGTGHDWLHANNVRNLSLRIAKGESGEKDLFLIELAALLHDYNDWKFQDKKENKQPLRLILADLNVDQSTIDDICFIAENMSYKGGINKVVLPTIEGKIVQDADRLEAMGAIGIARAFMYGGYRGNVLYDPTIPITSYRSAEDYKTRKNSVINHFYEKLLLLKDRLNTITAKKIARKRHNFMLKFLNQFYSECEGES